MNIGETLKRLRREKNMTQEQLAEYLNISTQAVSKWETGLSYPDITLIPVLANILDTSADTLLGIDISAKEKRIQEIKDRGEKYLYTGYAAKAAEVFREGLKEYPNSYRLMYGLIFSLWHLHIKQKTEEEKTETVKEVICLGEKILSECTEDDIRHGAIELLCYTYPEVGETEKAVKLARKMPHLSNQDLLSNIYIGTQRFEIMRDNLCSNVNFLIMYMKYNDTPMDDGSSPYTMEELIDIRKKVISFLDIMIEDKNYGFYRQTLAWNYIEMAVLYAKLKDYMNAIDCLKLAAGHAITNDTEYDPDREYTCLLFRGMKYGEVQHNIPENDSLHQLNEMKDPAFDPIRHSAEFMEIEERLKKYAKMR